MQVFRLGQLLISFYCGCRRRRCSPNTATLMVLRLTPTLRTHRVVRYVKLRKIAQKIICNTTQYNTIQFYTITIQYNTIQYNTIQFNTIQYNLIQYQYNTIQFNTIQNENNTIHTSYYASARFRTASYGPSFSLPFMAQARSTRAMKTRKEKTKIHDLPYGPSKTRF